MRTPIGARDIRDLDFRTADVIAGKLRIAREAIIRVRAGISFELTEALGQGHCGLPMEELATRAEKLLDVPCDLIASNVDLEVSEGTVIVNSQEAPWEPGRLTFLKTPEEQAARPLKRRDPAEYCVSPHQSP